MNYEKGKFVDIVGEVFGRWKVISYEGKSKNGQTMWLCECSCINKTVSVVNGGNLKSGKSSSCGCKQKERAKECATIHGLRNTRLYMIHVNMRKRCESIKNPAYKNYGGRGIKVCEDWQGKEGFARFYSWSLENGYSDELSIDRIDNNKGYDPDNCRWATIFEHANNRRSNISIEIGDRTQNLEQWAKESGLSRETILLRKEKGLSGFDLLKPSKKNVSERQSGVKGITWNKKNEKWLVRCFKNKKRERIGLFKNLEDAINALEKEKINDVKDIIYDI